MRTRDRASSSSRALHAWTLTRGAPTQAGNFQNLGTALLNLGNTEGGTVEAVQLYIHALACFRLALAELGGGDGSAEVVKNIQVVESNCRRRYNRLCEDMPEAALQASTLAEAGRMALVGALLAPHIAATRRLSSGARGRPARRHQPGKLAFLCVLAEHTYAHVRSPQVGEPGAVLGRAFAIKITLIRNPDLNPKPGAVYRRSNEERGRMQRLGPPHSRFLPPAISRPLPLSHAVRLRASSMAWF
jgi:hypothetical protein